MQSETKTKVDINYDETEEYWDVSGVKDMAAMFYSEGDAMVFNGDITTWITSSVTNMAEMFENAGSFDQDISSWNVSEVTSMDYMFANASDFDQNIRVWDVSGTAVPLTNMFDGATEMLSTYSSTIVTPHVTNFFNQ